MKKNKTILLGWDAADWKAIRPLIDKGWMPNLQNLMASGIYGSLSTLDPPLSPTLWTSIATGKRPYNHGILGFTEPKEDRSGVQPVLNTNRKCKALWNIFTQCDITSHIIGWWPSHPAEPIKGSMISNFYQKANKPKDGESLTEWPLMPSTIHPESWEDEIGKLRVHPHELSSAQIIPFIPDGEKLDQTDPVVQNLIMSLRNIIADCCTIQSACTYILQNKQWDFIGAYFDAIDHFGHGFMKFHPPQMDHIPDHLFDGFNNVITAGYRLHDMMLGRIMDLIDEDTNLILISDHGFHPDHLRLKTIPKYPGAPALEHSPYGIIVASGPDIAENKEIFGASLLDITPSILALYNLDIGNDMDGKVLMDIFKNKPSLNYISSWEDVAGVDGSHPVHLRKNHVIDEAAMQQLIELGYVEKPDPNAEIAITRTTNELNFWLAKSLIDGSKYNRAIAILEPLFNENPEQTRYGEVLAHCYKLSGASERAKELLGLMQATNSYDRPNQLLLQAKMLLSKDQALEALEVLYELKALVPDSVDVHLYIGQAYVLINDLDSAKGSFDTALKIDSQSYMALNGLGTVAYMQQDFQTALKNLSSSLSLNYHQSTIHRTLGHCLLELGDEQTARKALFQAEALEEASKSQSLDKNDSVNIIDKRTSERKHKKEFIIVSGLPRSGTSMMMQMLEAGGITIYTDQERIADESNPKGYYEHKNIMNIMKDKAFLNNVESGTSMKIIAQLLMYLPLTHNYKIIFMQRPMSEILDSQKKMLLKMKVQDDRINVDRPVEELHEAFNHSLKKINQWVDSMPNVEILRVNYSDTITSPSSTISQLVDFLSLDLDQVKMVGVVDKSLYRSKSASEV